MIGGAVALFAYTWSVMWVMFRYKPSAHLAATALFLFGLRLRLAFGLYSSIAWQFDSISRHSDRSNGTKSFSDFSLEDLRPLRLA